MPIGFLSALLAAKPKRDEVEYLIFGKVFFRELSPPERLTPND
jgi:hypothetical protein